jgi:DNA-binding transcriptional LysR family regulator
VIAMTLEQLRIFVAVAERQHVSQAAQALNLVQSAVSHAIAALETRHDTKLFDRVGRRIELTDAGRMFLGEARAVLARAEAAELALSEIGGLKRGHAFGTRKSDDCRLLAAAPSGRVSTSLSTDPDPALDRQYRASRGCGRKQNRRFGICRGDGPQ